MRSKNPAAMLVCAFTTNRCQYFTPVRLGPPCKSIVISSALTFSQRSFKRAKPRCVGQVLAGGPLLFRVRNLTDRGMSGGSTTVIRSNLERVVNDPERLRFHGSFGSSFKHVAADYRDDRRTWS